MKRLMILAAIVVASLVVGVLGVSTLAGERGVLAANHTLEYNYHVSIGRPLINARCDQDAPAAMESPDDPFAICPAMAAAGESVSGVTNDQSIEMKGNGTLSIDAANGTPITVTGGGFFVHKSGEGDDEESVVGSWEAKELLMFETYGPGDAILLGDRFPDLDTTAWRTGRALIMIHLKDERGEEADAILEIGCRLPGNAGISGTIEGIRLLVGGGGLNFNVPADPRATLFVLSKGDDSS